MPMRVVVSLWLACFRLSVCERSPLNIVHIVVDDLRPELGAYGLPDRHTPNIDSLAASGVSFDRAYTQIAVCGPSRNSFLTGRRPDRSRSWNMINHFREDHPEWTSLPGMFKKAGMNSLGAGKIYHPFLPPKWDGNNSWSHQALPFDNPCWFYGISCLPCVGRDGIHVKPKCNDHGFGPGAVETCWCEIEATEDVLTVDRALSLLDIAERDYKNHGKLFYLAVGLHKPHLPWQASKKYFDIHRSRNISLAVHKTAPKGMPGVAFSSCDSKSPWDPIADEDARNARIAYYAATSGMDEQVGRVLDALKKSNLLNNTAVILHGDHGWQLGEHGEWRKNTNFELGTRVPLIMSGPEWFMERSAGSRSDAPTELVDLMPTFADLAGIELSAVMQADETPLDGASLVPLVLQDRKLPGASKHQMAFSQYPRRVKDPTQPWSKNGIDHTNRSLFTVMGYSVRTSDWRYTEWRRWQGDKLQADWNADGLIASELYDHRNETMYPTDFDSRENDNLSTNKTTTDDATGLQGIINQLSRVLRSEFGQQASSRLDDAYLV